MPETVRSVATWVALGERQERQRWQDAVDRVRSRYPRDDRTPDATAFLARLVCDEIARLAGR